MRNKTRSGTALVTGASGGIGLHVARELAARGFDLALVARREDQLQAAAAELARTHGATCRVLSTDLARHDAPVRVHDWATEASPSVDVLVNNAGFGLQGRFVETDPGRELEMLQLNVVTLTSLTKVFARDMVARRAGRILNVASTAAFVPGPFMAVYYASKAYVLSLSVALADELAGSGVTVTALCPGPTQTSFGSTAGVEGSRLFRSNVMNPAAVARAGVEGMLAGRGMVVPGLRNRLLASTSGLVPRAVTARIARGLHELDDGRS
jgi:short-subunit dehydrogenase